MTVTVPKKTWQQYFRVQTESSFGAGGASYEWWHAAGGATGWMDLPVVPDGVRFTPNEAQIFTRYASGDRAMNRQPPIAGAYNVTGSIEMAAWPELIDRMLYACLGAVQRTQTAGSFSMAATALGSSTYAFGTQSNGTEQIKISFTGAATGTTAAIAVMQGSTTLETITIGSATTGLNGTYYTRGGYDGSSTAITLDVSGMATAGTISASGVDKTTNVFTLGTTVPTLKIEEGGQPKSASNSMYYTGVVVPTLVFTFDRTAADGLLMVTATVASKFPSAATAGTWANDARTYYYPTAGWTCTITKDGSAFDKLQVATVTVQGGAALFPVASGTQDASGAYAGPAEVTGTFTILPEDATEWNNFTGQTEADYTLTFTLPQYIVDTTGYSITFELTDTYLENYVETVRENLFGADLTIRTIKNATDGIVKITTVSRMPV